MVLDSNLLKCVGRDTIIIDIASAPGGVDFECAKRFGINASLCLSLPGKYSPQTSGKILHQAMHDYFFSELEE